MVSAGVISPSTMYAMITVVMVAVALQLSVFNSVFQ